MVVIPVGGKTNLYRFLGYQNDLEPLNPRTGGNIFRGEICDTKGGNLRHKPLNPSSAEPKYNHQEPKDSLSDHGGNEHQPVTDPVEQRDVSDNHFQDFLQAWPTSVDAEQIRWARHWWIKLEGDRHSDQILAQLHDDKRNDPEAAFGQPQNWLRREHWRDAVPLGQRQRDAVNRRQALERHFAQMAEQRISAPI